MAAASCRSSMTALMACALASLGATCPEQGDPTTYTVVVNATGSGSGVITGQSFAFSCLVDGGVEQDPCAITRARVPGNYQFRADANAGSVFLGWLSSSGTVHSCSGAPALAECEVVIEESGSDTVVIRPYFGLDGLVEHRLDVELVIPSGAPAGVLMRVVSADGDVDCRSEGGPNESCSAVRPAGSNVALHALTNSIALDHWSGCDSATATECFVVMDRNRVVAARWVRGQSAISVFPIRTAGSGRIVSDPAVIDCQLPPLPRTPDQGAIGTCTGTASFSEPFTLTAIPDSGSTFVGWGPAHACGTAVTCTMDLYRTGDVVVHPAFVGPALVIVGNGDGTGTVSAQTVDCTTTAGVTSGDCEGDFNLGVDVTLTAAAAAGSVFTGWGGTGVSCSGTAPCVIRTGLAPRVTASFALAPAQTFPLTISFTGDGSGNIRSSPAGIDCTWTAGVVAGTCTAGFPEGTSIALDVDAVQSSAVFSGCTFDGIDVCRITLAAPDTVAVTLTPTTAPLTLLFAGTGSGNIRSSPAGIDCTSSAGAVTGSCTATFQRGSQIVLDVDVVQSTASFSGCAFEGPDLCRLTLHSPDTVIVTLTPTTAPLTVLLQGAGSGNVRSSPAGIDCTSSAGTVSGACTASLQRGTEITLDVDAIQSSASFDGCAFEPPDLCRLTLNGPDTVTVMLTPQAPNVTLTVALGSGFGTVTSNPPGISCSNASTGGPGSFDCSEDYPAGTVVTLTAAPASGLVFTGWSGACSGSGACVVTMSEARSVAASFGFPSFTLTITGAGSGDGLVSEFSTGLSCGITSGTATGTCLVQVSSGLVLNLMQLAAAGSSFGGWGGDCSGTGSCLLVMDRSRTVSATFNR